MNNGYQAKVWVKSDNSDGGVSHQGRRRHRDGARQQGAHHHVQPDTAYRIRVQAWGTGTTNLRAKVWRTDGAEPSAWSVSATDTTAGLQSAGGIAVQAYLSGSATSAPVTLTISDLLARPTGN